MLYCRFAVAVVFSLLLHLLLLALLLLQPAPLPAAPKTKAAPLSVQIIQWPGASTTTVIKEKNTATMPTEPTATASSPKTINRPQAQRTGRTQRTKATKSIKRSQPTAEKKRPDQTKLSAQAKITAKPKASLTQPVTAAAEPGITNRILDSVAARQQQQATELSSAEIQALQQKTVPDKAISVTRSGPKPSYAADNVLEVLNDGSFIEKIGDYCYQAKPGADLRRDISSMKPVTCGEDANEVLYHSIMDKVGKNRR